MDFALDWRIAASSHPLAKLRLCEARLQDDARFPWVVLIPRRAGLVELADLPPRDTARLWDEALLVGEAARAIGGALGRPVLKLNHGQLGNVVEQFHVHVVGRRADDVAWPHPVWGFGAAEPYGPEALRTVLDAARRALA